MNTCKYKIAYTNTCGLSTIRLKIGSVYVTSSNQLQVLGVTEVTTVENRTIGWVLVQHLRVILSPWRQVKIRSKFHELLNKQSSQIIRSNFENTAQKDGPDWGQDLNSRVHSPAVTHQGSSRVNAHFKQFSWWFIIISQEVLTFYERRFTVISLQCDKITSECRHLSWVRRKMQLNHPRKRW